MLGSEQSISGPNIALNTIVAEELCQFADKLEKACVKTIEDGKMTKDLALITTIPNPVVLNSEDFIKAIRSTLEGMLSL